MNGRYVVDPDTGCWDWTGARNQKGYPQTRYAGRRQGAHRAIYVEVNGPIAPGLDVDHLCRNRNCINPDHLEAVTHAVNIQRGTLAKLNPEKVVAIRKRIENGARQDAVASEYGVTPQAINHIVHGRTWKNVPAALDDSTTQGASTA